jgi:hypothetical protein
MTGRQSGSGRKAQDSRESREHALKALQARAPLTSGNRDEPA